MKILDHFKSNSLAKQIFLMLVIIFIVFFLVYNSLKIYTKHNRYIEVPYLAGKNLDEAISILDNNKLRYEVLDSSKFFVNIPNYSVISQIPKELELVKKNRKIYLNVNAESILTALGFKVRDYSYVDNIGKDMVLDVLYLGEKILPGQKIPMNSEIDLIRGNGER